MFRYLWRGFLPEGTRWVSQDSPMMIVTMKHPTTRVITDQRERNPTNDIHFGHFDVLIFVGHQTSCESWATLAYTIQQYLADFHKQPGLWPVPKKYFTSSDPHHGNHDNDHRDTSLK